MRPRQIFLVMTGVIVACACLGGCAPAPSPTALPTPVPPIVTPRPLPSPTPTPRPLRTLTLCLGAEPVDLYIHSGVDYTQEVVLEAIYDGPIDARGYSYQPVILEKLPSLADGDAVVSEVTVGIGDMVVDDSGDLVQLAEGLSSTVRLRPAGCHASDCAVEYTGGTLEMEQMLATFTIKPGVTWADGTPVTVADSVFSYQLYVHPDAPVADIARGDRTAGYQAVDEHTVVWTGRPGYWDGDYATNFWTPLPNHQMGLMTVVEIFSSKELVRIPMGYGPFTVKEWVPGYHITVERNPYYFRAAEGLPYFDRVIFRFFGEDTIAGIEALLNGRCDVLTWDTRLDDQIERLLELEAAGQVRLYASGTGSWEHLDFGINPAPDYERPDFFEDVRMRRAMAMCLDRRTVVDELLYGRSTVLHSYIPPDHPLYDGQVQEYPYDPAQAMALLGEMGWRDEDGDGIREAHGVEGISEGTRLAFKWGSTTQALRVAYMQIFQANLRACGFEVTLENLPAAQWFAGGPDGPAFGRRFDLGTFTWPVGVEPPCSTYLCSQIPSEGTGWAGNNLVGYCSAAYDAACNAALQALPGMPEYEYYHRQAQIIFSRDLPALPLFMRLRFVASRPDLRGLVLDPSEDPETWNIEAFRLEP